VDSLKGGGTFKEDLDQGSDWWLEDLNGDRSGLNMSESAQKPCDYDIFKGLPY
jgi:hypothetical protein